MRILITGSCGFIGTCFALRLLNDGYDVIGIDNLSRKGSEINLKELMKLNKKFTFYNLDLSNREKLFELFSNIGKVDSVFHFASQVAVTTSYQNRILDFNSNALASFNLIEGIKNYFPHAYCLYSSTNKVYGYLNTNKPVGIKQPLDPYTPYGISKAVGELYFTEYGRKEIGLSTCSLRQSCIYGHHQYGIEDQGWMAWFTIANLFDIPITIYGDGNQIRDLLFIEDLIDLYLECLMKRIEGRYPVGGGTKNRISITDGMEIISKVSNKEFKQISYEKTRPGDQPYFVADLSWTKDLGLSWKPIVSNTYGVEVLVDWVNNNSALIKNTLCI